MRSPVALSGALLLLAACGGKEEPAPAQAPAAASKPAAVEAPREAAERLAGLRFAKAPELAGLDEPAFADALLKARSLTESRRKLLGLIGWPPPGEDSPEKAREAVAKEDLAAFYSPAEHKVFERKDYKPVLDYGRSPEYWRAHKSALVARAFVLALYHQHEKLARTAETIADDGVRLHLRAALEAEATWTVAPLLAAALVRETRRNPQLKEAKDEDVRAFLLKDRLMSPLGAPDSVEQGIVAQLAFERERFLDNRSNSLYAHWLRKGRWTIACAELEAAKRRGKTPQPGLLRNPPLSLTWPGGFDRGGFPRTYVRFRDPQALLGPDWKLLEEGSLGWGEGDRFALFERGDRAALILYAHSPSGNTPLTWVRHRANPSAPGIGGYYGAAGVTLIGIDEADVPRVLPRILQSAVTARLEGFKEVEEFFAGAPKAPDPAAEESRLRQVAATNDMTWAFPAACQRHPDRAAAWIREFTPAFLAALEKQGFNSSSRSLMLLGLVPHATSEGTWKAFLDAVAAQAKVDRDPSGNDRYAVPAMGSLSVMKERPGMPASEPQFAFLERQQHDRLYDRSERDIAAMKELGARVAGAAAALWIERQVDDLKRMMQSGEVAKASGLARKYRAWTTDEKALRSLDAILGTAASSAGVEVWRVDLKHLTGARWVASRDALYIAGETQIQAIDLVHGKLLWNQTMPGKLVSEHVWEGRDAVAALCGDFVLAGWSKKDGAKLWERAIGRRCFRGAAGGGIVALDTADGVAAFDLATGKPAWTFGKAGVLHGEQEGILVQPRSSNDLAWLDPATGRERWRFDAPYFHDARTVRRHGTRLLVRGENSTLDIDAAVGKPVRTMDGLFTGHATERWAALAPVPVPGTLPREGFSIVDRTTGQQAWTKPKGRVVLLSGDSCGWHERGTFAWSDAATGRARWAATLDDCAGALAFPGSLVVTTGRSLHAFDPSTGSAQWTCPDVSTGSGTLAWAVGGNSVWTSSSFTRVQAVSAERGK